MNERIWELAKKAGINLTPAQFSGVLEDEVDEFTLEDFAELIVLEMCDVFDKRAEPGTGFYEPHEPAEMIRAHFGVEE